MTDKTWDKDLDGPMLQMWRELFRGGETEPMIERTNIAKMESALSSLRPSLIDAPWRAGRLMQACGFTETQLTTLMFDPIEHTPGTQPSAAHWIADRIEDLFVAAFPDPFRRAGDTVFSSDVLDQLAAAGCTVEETSLGISIHLANYGGSIRGDVLAQALAPPRLEAHEFKRERMFFPVDKVRDVHSGPDYLKHDPTKRHSRKRPTTKRSKHR